MEFIKKHKLKSIIAALAVIATIAYAAGFERIAKDTLILGTGTSASKSIEFDLGLGASNPKLRANSSSPNLEFATDGASFLPFGSGGGGASGVNVITNGDFELGIASNWTASGGTFTNEEGADLLNGSKSASWIPSAASETLTTDQASLPLVVDGQSCLTSFFYKNGDANYYAEVIDSGSNVLAGKQLETSTIAKEIVLPFLCPSADTIAVRLRSTAAAAEIFLDDVFAGTRDRVRKSLQIVSVDDPNLTLAGGGLRLSDGRILKTYDGSGTTSSDYGKKLTVSLDTILGGNPTDATTYSLCIDNNSLTASSTLTDTGEKIVSIQEGNLALLTSNPEDLLLTRYTCLGWIKSATTGTVWSGDGSYFDDYPKNEYSGSSKIENYILNPRAEPSELRDLAITGMTVEAETAAPLEGKKSFKLTSVANTDFVIFNGAALNEIDENQLMTATAWTRLDTGVAADFTICVYDGAACVAGTSMPIPAGKWPYLAQFPTVAGTTYSIRVDADATSKVVVIDDLRVTSELTVSANPKEPWKEFTPVWTTSGGAQTVGTGVLSGYYSRDGEDMIGKIVMSLGTGFSVSSGIWYFDIPDSKTLNVDVLTPNTTGNTVLEGNGWITDATNGSKAELWNIQPGKDSNNTTQMILWITSTGHLGTTPPTTGVYTVVDADSPITWAINDRIEFNFKIPIAEWASSAGAISNIHRSMLSNSNTATTGDNDAAFSYLESGQAIVAFSDAGNNVRKRVQAQVGAQNSDAPWELVVSPGNNKWISASSMFPYIEDGAAKYGMKLENIANDTDMYVVFGGDGARQAEAWSTYTSWNWGVRKASAYGKVLAGLAGVNTPGLVQSFKNSSSDRNIESGTYTITASNQNAEVSSFPSNGKGFYTRIGNIVYVTGYQDIVPATGTAEVAFHIDLPIARGSNFAGSVDARGLANCHDSGTASSGSGYIYSVGAAQRVLIATGSVGSTGTTNVSFNFSYELN